MPSPRRSPPTPKLALIGVLGGLLSGLLGVGGGVIMVPALVLWAGYGQRDAHAISLAAIIPISAVAVATYGAAGEVSLGAALALALGAAVGARIGAGALTRISEDTLQLAFGAFVVVAALLLAVLP